MSAPGSIRILPDKDQIIAADPGQSVFVTANAGSGKTSTLVDRVARLLLARVEPGQILCVTYTKAAAAEMQSRLFQRLGKWAVMDDAELRASLADLDQRDPERLSRDDLSQARELFAQALETPGGLKIQTLHAFCEKLLRRFPLEAGVSPGFEVLEDAAARELSRAARDDLARLAHADPDGPLGQAYAHFAVALDFRAFEALLSEIETQRARLTDYTRRVADGVSPGPWEVAGASPDQPPEHLAEAFMADLDPTRWRTIADAMATGSVTDQSCAERMRMADWSFDGLAEVFLTQGSPRARMATAKAPANAAAFLNAIQTAYVGALDAMRRARLARDTVHVLTLAEVHARLYDDAKSHRGALDFADLTHKAVELLTRRASAAWVLYKLDGGIDHVLLDEAQDTAPEQWSILETLTENFFAGEGAPRRGEPRIPQTVFAVGDEKQSIYSFQGARPEQLLQQNQAYSARVIGAGRAFAGPTLAKSFRSAPEVLGFVDQVFSVVPTRQRALSGEQGSYSLHTTSRSDHHGAIELWPLYREDPAEPREAWDAPLDLEPAESGRKRLARDLATEIRRQVEAGVAVHDRSSGDLRPVGYGDFLVLVRRRDATFEEIIRACKTAGVPVAGADRLKLSQHVAFDDLISLARFALFPEDELSLAEILRGPFCDVDEDGLFDLAGADPKRGNLWRELQRRSDDRPEWRAARTLLDFTIETRGRAPFDFFSGLLNCVDADGRAGRARILSRLGREAEEAIDETLNQVLAAEARGGVDLETALAMLEAADVEVKRELEGPRGEVRVMTVHGAKGLEAPVVILPDTTARAKAQGPSLMALDQDDRSEVWLMCPGSRKDDCEPSAFARDARQARTDAETLRLLYVALTRARDRIMIMGRACGSGQAGFEPGSWWDVLTETFERTPFVTDGDVRRIGPRPVTLAPHTVSAGEAQVDPPPWARTAPAPDASAPLAAPSQLSTEAVRMPAPSPLAEAGEGLGRFRRGDLIHRLLERLPEIAEGERAGAASRMMSRERGLSDDQRAEMIAAAMTILGDDRFAPVFGPGSRAEVALTGSAPDLPAGVAISGRIDRLVITPERVLVVDYKTNRPAPDRVEDADPAYVLQLATYVAVLKRLYPDHPIEAALVWTDGPRLMAVPGAMMDAALSALR